ncbi:MAG: fused MFS/spermidine synthase [Nevskia sp.]
MSEASAPAGPVSTGSPDIPLHRPSVIDDGDSRRLYFGPEYVQSEMSLEDPWFLSLRYTQKMMAFLLFVPKPRHIVIVGLGGGSLTKFCHRQLPRTRITTIEIDPRVIALAGRFQVPEPDARMQIVQADACDWFAETDERMDVVLLDGYDERGISGGFGNARFYRDLRACLRPGGVLVANILVTAAAFRRYRQVIAGVFEAGLLDQRVMPDGNHVLTAFTSFPTDPDWTAIGREAKKLALRHRLDFPAFTRALRRAHERGAAEPVSEDDGIPIF